MAISVDIEKKLGNFELQVKFEAANETLALLGASGCGKSLTLRCIAGIEKPDKGKIVLNGKVLFDSEKNIDITPRKRNTGLMFQNYALFPNMTVIQNIKTGASRIRNKAEKVSSAEEIMELFGLTKQADLRPWQLSGGQKQRTALARILISDPDILLLDEPFSALDEHLRLRLETELARVIKAFGKTVILVTHNKDEAYRLSQKVAVINNGHIDVLGSKESVFADPHSVPAALITGYNNISSVKKAAGFVYASEWGVDITHLSVPDDTEFVAFKGTDIKPGGGLGSIKCRVESVTEDTGGVNVLLRANNAGAITSFSMYLEKECSGPAVGSIIDITIPEGSVKFLKGPWK